VFYVTSNFGKCFSLVIGFSLSLHTLFLTDTLSLYTLQANLYFDRLTFSQLSMEAEDGSPLSEEQSELLEQTRVQVLSIIGTLGGLLDEDEDEEDEPNEISAEELLPLRETILALYAHHAGDNTKMSHRLINKPLSSPTALPLLTCSHGLDEYQRAQLWYLLHSAGGYMADVIAAQVQQHEDTAKCDLCAKLGALCLKYRARLQAVSGMHKQAIADRRSDADQHTHALRLSRAEAVVATDRAREATAEASTLSARLAAAETALEEARTGRERAERAVAGAEEEARDWRARAERAEEEAEGGRREAERLRARIKVLEAYPGAEAEAEAEEEELEPGAMRVPAFLAWLQSRRADATQSQTQGQTQGQPQAEAQPLTPTTTSTSSVPDLSAASAARMLDASTEQLITALQSQPQPTPTPGPDAVSQEELARINAGYAQSLRALAQKLSTAQDDAAASVRQVQAAEVEAAATRRLLATEQSRVRDGDRRCREVEGKLGAAVAACERERARYRALQTAALDLKNKHEATTHELAELKLEVSQWMTAMQSPAVMMRKEKAEKERVNTKQLMDKMLKGPVGKKTPGVPVGTGSLSQTGDQVNSTDSS
jgi:hypothetical protein